MGWWIALSLAHTKNPRHRNSRHGKAACVAAYHLLMVGPLRSVLKKVLYLTAHLSGLTPPHQITIEIGLKKSVVSDRAFVWPDPPTPNYHFSPGNCRKTRQHMFFWDWFLVLYFTSPIRNYHRKAISLPQFVPWICAVQRSTNSNGLKVKIFGSTSISGYTDRVDEICAWLEAWKTDIWEGRGQWCARRHLSNDPCFCVWCLGWFTFTREVTNVYLISLSPKRQNHIEHQLVYPFWSTCLSFFFWPFFRLCFAGLLPDFDKTGF